MHLNPAAPPHSTSTASKWCFAAVDDPFSPAVQKMRQVQPQHHPSDRVFRPRSNRLTAGTGRSISVRFDPKTRRTKSRRPKFAQSMSSLCWSLLVLPTSNYFSAVQFGTPGIEFLHIEAEYTALHSHPNKVKDVKALLSPMK